MGAAPDGGLYIPLVFPKLSLDEFSDLEDLPGIAKTLLTPFFEGDVLAPALGQICDDVFNFPAPLMPLAKNKQALELFHGPTGAFKDFGARFLANSMDHMANNGEPLTVLVATSGDTGGAVGCAFAKARNAKVVILFPKGRVSPFQERQLTCWPNSVRSLRVDGDFDDCQRLVKAAFADKVLKKRFGLSSANSINIGRLLPQMVYYAASALQVFQQTGKPANFIIPSGNLGNGMACLWARQCGLPIQNIIFAQNANRALVDYFAGDGFTPKASIPTIANAMDVGNPSNFERFMAGHSQLNHSVHALSVDDAAIAAQITKDARENGHIWCPHSAIAAFAYEQLNDEERDQNWVLVATAHPFKFKEVVEPLIGREITPNAALKTIETLPTQVRDIPAQLSALAEALGT